MTSPSGSHELLHPISVAANLLNIPPRTLRALCERGEIPHTGTGGKKGKRKNTQLHIAQSTINALLSTVADFCPIKIAQRQLGVSERTIYRWELQGKITVLRTYKGRGVRQSDVERLKRLPTQDEVCRLLRVSKRTLHNWVQHNFAQSWRLRGILRYQLDGILPEIEQFLTVKEAAQLSSTSPDRVRAAIRRGLLPSTQLPSRRLLRVRASDLRRGLPGSGILPLEFDQQLAALLKKSA